MNISVSERKAYPKELFVHETDKRGQETKRYMTNVQLCTTMLHENV